MINKVSIDIEENSKGIHIINFIYENKVIVKDDIENIRITIENEDRSYREIIENLSIDNIENNQEEIICKCKYKSIKLETEIEINIIYKIINENLIEKRILLKQTNIPFLYYSIENSIVPGENPERYWSFDNIDNKGGVIREVFPAAGYMMDGIYVGLLTDAGHRNYWTRNIRRRPNFGNKGFTAIREACDVNLYRLPKLIEREEEKHYVKITLGQLVDYNYGNRVEKNIDNEFRYENNEGNIVIPLEFEDGFYDVYFEHKSESNIGIQILKEIAEGQTEINGFDYQEDIPSSMEEWTIFNDQVILFNTEDKRSFIQIKGSIKNFSIKNFRIIKVNGVEKPYHRLMQGQISEKRLFILAKRMDCLRDIRYYSQILLSDGLGFKGNDYEKILYADMQMLTWITSANDFSPLNVPSINYAPDMYNRDSFWSIIGINDKELSEKIWRKWGSTQNELGAIGTIITPYMGSLEVKGNEATCEWIWWAYINKVKYGIEPDIEKIKKAYDYCINEFDSDKDGIVKSHFVLGQNDVQTYFDYGKTTSLSVNQGVFAVTLKVAKALGIEVSEEYIEKAVNGYRGFYDEERGYLLNTLDYKDAISVGDLMPEFMALWLFDEGLLNKDIVKNTLEKIPVIDSCATFIGHVNKKYFSGNDSPFDSKFSWTDGVYYNGGSWLREEIMAYAVGVRYGLNQYKDRIVNRMEKEINLIKDDPVSHEFLPTDLTQEGCLWKSIRVFSWNVFAIKAIEVANMKENYEGD
ncbi:hypothetical protein [Clostridium paraputrificum]|uniref:Uncharacterized protein n=1 Tax=Clostridium paraputrificum TaxID=29363 RepID=A0A6N3C8N0_9CLOT